MGMHAGANAPTVDQVGQIHAILESLDKLSAQRETENRRRSQRLTVRLGLSATVLGGPAGAPMRIYTRNLSRSGMGFVSRRLFRKEERLAVLLKVQGQGKLVLAEITFCRYVRRGLYESGARFLEAVKEGEGEGQVPAHWGSA
jgi:hypothetical protein